TRIVLARTELMGGRHPRYAIPVLCDDLRVRSSGGARQRIHRTTESHRIDRHILEARVRHAGSDERFGSLYAFYECLIRHAELLDTDLLVAFRIRLLGLSRIAAGSAAAGAQKDRPACDCSRPHSC